jgi:DNA-directed RNA polymerase subunit RPC12/RpoP
LHKIADNSIDFGCTSVPFDDHYEYTTNAEDFGFNSNDFKEPGTSGFWKQMDFLTPQLYRVTKPGHVWMIHVKDRILYSYQVDHGLTSVYPFSDETVMHFIKHGFVYEGRRTIVTDVVRENNSTYRLGYTEMSIDASTKGSGLPEYFLMFRKPNTDQTQQRSDERVTKFKFDNRRDLYVCGNCKHEILDLNDMKCEEFDLIYKKYRCPNCGKWQMFYSRGQWQLDASSFWQSNTDSLVTQEFYDYNKHWQKMHDLDSKGNLSASFLQVPPESKSDMVWDDVAFMQGLNAEQSRRNIANHICPLPFDIVKRAIMLYSDIGDVVLDPFAGLFTVPYCAIQLGRKGYGIESVSYTHLTLPTILRV